MAAKNVIIWWSCVCLVKVIEATSCDVSLSTGSNIVQLNSNVSLTCSVCNYVSGTTIVDFFHNNNVIFYLVFGIKNIINTTLHDATTSFDNGNMTLTLTIQKFIETSQGNYTCSILNPTSSATQFVWLKVPVTSVTLTPEDKAVNAVEGLPIYSMKCVSSHGRPSPYITWYLDSGTKDTYFDDVNITMYTNVSNSNDVTTSTLSLTPTRSVNNQSIYCNVSNGDFVISSTHRLRLNILTYPSRPIIQYNGTNVNDVSIIKGRNISFVCSSIGVPTPVISWKTPSGEVINNTVLTIPIVQNGSYKCSAQSILSPSHGENITATNTSIFSVNVLYPPKVISCTIGAEYVVSSRIVKVVQNEPFAMNCTSDGNPPPTSYTWLHPDGRQLTETKLTLTSVKSIGNNRYTLQVSNAMKGTFDIEETLGHLNATYTLDILFPPMVPALHYKGSTGMLINTPAINVIRGSQVTILCNASSNPDPRYNWFVDGIQTSYASIWNDTIQSQTKVQCSVSNTMNATGKKSVETSTNSSVQILAMFAPETPTFTFNACGSNVQTKYLKVIQGHYVNGTCITNSYPTSIYSWIPGFYGSLKSFFISTSNASHIGNYTCTATNTMNTTFDGIIEGNTKSSFFLDILVPVDVQSIANATVVLNSNFSVACHYTGGNKSNVSLTWARNGTTRIMDTRQTLTLPFIKLTDEGYYTCKVSYRLEPTLCEPAEGNDESSFFLDVQYAANISRFHAVGFDVSSQTIIINESQSVTLFCEADSDPLAYIEVINRTRGSTNVLRGLHNNTNYASIDNARCEYDMGVYECKGNNTHNEVQQMRTLDIFINCAPRPSPFSPLKTAINRKTNESVIITFTVVAYPLPRNLTSYVWKKRINNQWVTLQNSSGFFIYISNDRLQTNLSKYQLTFEDFTNYTVNVNNDIGSWEQNFVIRANEKPSAPERFKVVEDLVIETSVTIEWKPGFDGGEEQRFVILYKKATDNPWTNKTLSGAITRIVIDGLSPGTTYEVKMYSENTIGKSEETDVQHVVTKSYSDTSRSSAVTAIGAGVGGSIVCVVVIIGVVFVIWRKRNNELQKSDSQKVLSRRLINQSNGAYENIGMVTPRMETKPTKEETESSRSGIDVPRSCEVGNKLAPCLTETKIQSSDKRALKLVPDKQSEQNNSQFTAGSQRLIKHSTVISDISGSPLAAPSSDTSSKQRRDSYSIEHDPIYDNIYKKKTQFKSRHIRIENLRENIIRDKNNKTDVFTEFSALSVASETIKESTNAAIKTGNTSKNRYKNMYPYDKNRVILSVIGNDIDTDFINASFIDGYSCPKKYIAAQGPLADTIADFWRMILENNVRVVVMVTNLVEDSKRKCVQYWPKDAANNCQYGDSTVHLLSEDIYADFVVRTFECKRNGSTKTVTHLHFTAWPDKDVPDTALSLLQFWRKVRSFDRSEESPWIVHCSAGVGRTGTFIALDYLYEQGVSEKHINVFDAVLLLREQRVNMVQTKNQYSYLHEVLCEALSPVGEVLSNKTFLEQNCAPNFLNEEYMKICNSHIAEGKQETVDDVYLRVLDGEKPENIDKNAEPCVVPDDKFRPVLSMAVNTRGHTDYINAVYLSTFQKKDRLILTQSANTSSDVDFVRLLHDHYVRTVVTLGDQMESYLPESGETIVIGPFTASSISFEQNQQFQEHFVRFKHIGERDGFDVLVFRFTNWSEQFGLCKSNELLALLTDVQERAATDGPVVIQCHDGYSRSGLVAVLWCLMERSKRDREVAIAETVRLIRRRRQQVISNEAQYSFCHEFMKECVEGCVVFTNA